MISPIDFSTSVLVSAPNIPLETIRKQFLICCLFCGRIGIVTRHGFKCRRSRNLFQTVLFCNWLNCTTPARIISLLDFHPQVKWNLFNLELNILPAMCKIPYVRRLSYSSKRFIGWHNVMCIFWVGYEHNRPFVQTNINKGEHVMIYCHNSVTEIEESGEWLSTLRSVCIFSILFSIHS